MEGWTVRKLGWRRISWGRLGWGNVLLGQGLLVRKLGWGRIDCGTFWLVESLTGGMLIWVKTYEGKLIVVEMFDWMKVCDWENAC